MELFNLNRLRRPVLIELAGKVDLKGRHRMRKRDLIQELRKYLPQLKDELARLRPAVKAALKPAGSSTMTSKSAPAPSAGPQFVDRGAALPTSYTQDKLVMLVRDPYWVFCYWELSGSARTTLEAQHGRGVFDGARWVLRVHSSGQGRPTDIEVQPEARNWYVNVRDNSDLFSEIGIITRQGEFLGLTKSNRVRTPRGGMSDQDGAEWMTVEGDYANIKRHVSRTVTIQAGTGQLLAERFGVKGLSSLFFGASQRSSRIPPK